MQIEGRDTVVVGAGVSGRAAARFLLDRGARVALFDQAEPGRLHPEVTALRAAGVELLAPDVLPAPERHDLAVVSPGVSVHAPPVRALAAAGVEVVGEVELASRFLTAPILAVTGTNGKTTVTELLGRLMGVAGARVFVGGNVGTPLLAAVGGSWDWVVAEVSSFQLETVGTFRPRVAVLLNLTDDHFDRHGDLAAYGRAKARIFENQGPGDAAVVNADDPAAWAVGRTAPSVLLPFSTERQLSAGAWLEGEDAVFLLPGEDGQRLPRGSPSLPGRHNLANLLAACLAAAWVGADPRRGWGEALAFPGLPHRLEQFLEGGGVRFVDDSKATNVGAALGALETVAAPVVWVAGGVDKGGDYAPLLPRVREVVRRAILAGPAAERLSRVLAGATALEVAPDWSHAFRAAATAARPGDTVLLAPACASFDAFSGYAARGDAFQRHCREAFARGGPDGR